MRKLDLSTATVSTVVGVVGGAGYASGTPLAPFSVGAPSYVAFWGYNLFMTDGRNAVIWKLDPASNTVVLLAGMNGSSASLDGPATSAQFNFPGPLTVDNVGNLFVIELVGYSLWRLGLLKI